MEAHSSLGNSLKASETLVWAPQADVLTAQLDGVKRIELNFSKFTDGRAFSQAVLLRTRLRFEGEIHATGDVLVDQLQQMKRCGFTSAALREDQKAEHAITLLKLFTGFYQADRADVDAQAQAAAGALS
jgi:uncharacterized protein (DUF934 family)